MRIKLIFPAIVLAYFAGCFAQDLAFTVEPSLSTSGGRYFVDFSLNKAADVAVSIVRVTDSSVVRHLAAGVLGNNPPAPLIPDSLHQRIEWDLKDDLGNLVADTAGLTVRVQSGMSVSMERAAGDNPYLFCTMSIPGIQGVAVDEFDGSVYLFGVCNTLRSTTIRKYDGEGTYLKTVYPFPAGMTALDVNGFGVNAWTDGRVSPKCAGLAFPTLSGNIVASNTSTLLPIVHNGELVVTDLTSLSITKFRTDSRFPESGIAAPLIVGTPLPTRSQRTSGGPTFLTLSPDGKYFLLSGYYATNAYEIGRDDRDQSTGASSTGFWQDGRVFKIDALTGAIAPLISLDSVPLLWADPVRISSIGQGFAYSAIHGTAFDDSGHIFICDRQHREVGVYDTLGRKIGAVPVNYPDLVSVNSRTGAVYVVTLLFTGYHVGVVNIKKFSSWRNPVETAALNSFVTQVDSKVHMVLSLSGEKSLIWFASYSSKLGVESQNSVWCIEDAGDSLKIIRDFYQQTAGENAGYDRIKADARTNTVYVNDGWKGLYKIEDWENPEVKPCSTSDRQRIYAWEMNMSADYREIYVRTHNSTNGGPIHRYSSDHYHAPAPFAGSGSNQFIPWIYSRFGAGYGERGLAVAPDGHVAVMYLKDWTTYWVTRFGPGAVESPADSPGTVMVDPVPANGGVEYDLKENLYVGLSVRAAGHVIPAGFESDIGYTSGVGAVVKWSAGDTGHVSLEGNVAERQPTGHARIYRPGFAPFSGNAPWYGCACRSPRFDVDDYGRLFIPNAITSRVSIVDNEDNLIAEFGEYGNIDSRGPGSLVPTAGVPLAFPVGAAATDDYVYVSDMVNSRVVRARMDYTLDNLPIDPPTAKAERRNTRTVMALTMAPNPFNPSTVLSFTADAGKTALVEIFNIQGKRICRLFEGRMGGGQRTVAWNAAGRPSGVYVARLMVEGKMLQKRLTLAR